VCAQLPTSADSVTLLAFAAVPLPLLSIHRYQSISPVSLDALQLQRSTDGRRIVTFRPCHCATYMYYAGSATNCLWRYHKQDTGYWRPQALDGLCLSKMIGGNCNIQHGIDEVIVGAIINKNDEISFLWKIRLPVRKPFNSLLLILVKYTQLKSNAETCL